MSSTRRSGRQRNSNKRYTIDPFEGLELIGDLEDDNHATPTADDGDQDAEFDAAAATPEPEEDNLSVDAAVEDEPEENESGQGDDDLDDMDSLIGGDEDGRTMPRANRGTGTVPPARANADKLYSRGLKDVTSRGSKTVRQTLFWGPSPDDQNPGMSALYKWKHQPCLPSRKADASGFGGFSKGFFRTEDMRNREMEEDWQWYDSHGGKEAFAQRQTMTPLSADEAMKYLPKLREPSKVVLGPFNSQNLSEMPMGACKDLNEHFLRHDSEGHIDEKTLRRGWMLNVGDKVQCLDWAPNQNRERQFLALATIALDGHDSDYGRFKVPQAPAYTPQKPYRAAIQIWEITANGNGSPDMDSLPKLRKVICTDWGDIRSLKWCPVPRKDDSSSDAQVSHRLGLLAGIWGDGAVRIFDVSVPSPKDAPIEYASFRSTAFMSCPLNTLCTSMTWLSSTGVAVGCANGCIGVWNIPTSIKDAQSNATPVLFTAVQTSYILSITSCYPSRPQFVLTTSMSGDLSMTDLTEISSAGGYSPTSTVFSQRSRIGRSMIAWHDWSQMILTVDDSNVLLAFPMRRVFIRTGLTRYPSPCTCIGISPVHPFVLAGTAGGEAISTNAVRRIHESKAVAWNVRWFTHEWRQAGAQKPNLAATANGDVDMMDVDHGQSTTVGSDKSEREGLIRILEGFKPEQAKLQNVDEVHSNRIQAAGYTTVYERESAVTQICWNPNIHVGGWAAAGTATGLLRIEDVAM